MAGTFTNQKEALAMAIEMEEEGHDFYVKTAKKAIDDMTKDVFNFLANEEKKHIESIKAFYNAEVNGQKTDTDKIIGKDTPLKAKRAILKLFRGLEEKAPVDKPDMEAYNFARDFEMIDDSMAFMENPEEWFHRQEKWHVEG